MANKCVIITPALRKLMSKYPALDAQLFRALIKGWRRNTEAGENAVPTQEEFESYLKKHILNWSLYIPKLTPTGKLSKLTDAQHTFVRSEEFKEQAGDWEKDDKKGVVMENGEPAVRYLVTADGEISARPGKPTMMGFTKAAADKRVASDKGETKAVPVFIKAGTKVIEAEPSQLAVKSEFLGLLLKEKLIDIDTKQELEVLTPPMFSKKIAEMFPDLVLMVKNGRAGTTYAVISPSQLIPAPVENMQPYSKPRHKADSKMSSVKKMWRTAMINRLFDQIVEEAIRIEKERLNALMNEAKDNRRRLQLANAIHNLRHAVIIRQIGARNIYYKVHDTIKDRIVPDSTDEEQVKRNKQYQIMLDCWEELMEDAAARYGEDYGVLIDLYGNTVREAYTSNIEDDGSNPDTERNDTAEEEGSKREGWQEKVKELSTFEKMGSIVRRSIGKVKKFTFDGKRIVDDLGEQTTYTPSYVFVELMEALSSMTDASEMIPLLEELEERKAWASQIIEELKADDQLFAAYYTVFRRDYQNLWAHSTTTSSDGTVTIKTVNINKPSSIAHYFDEWRDNYTYGIMLNDSSIYDSQGAVNMKNVKKLRETTGDIIDKIDKDKTAKGRQEISLTLLKEISDMLASVGISVAPDVLEANFSTAFKEDASVYDIPGRTLVFIIRSLTDELIKRKGIDGTKMDFINEYGGMFNRIALAVRNVEDIALEASTRQGKANYYHYIRPSFATTLIKRLRGPRGKSVIEEYAESEFFKKNGEWLCSLLEMLDTNTYEYQTEGDILPVEIDKKPLDMLAHMSLLQFGHKDYAKWTPDEAAMALLSQFEAGQVKRLFDVGYGWYALPVLGDKQSCEFIRLPRFGKLKLLVPLLAKVIQQEYNRIQLVRKRAGADVEKIAFYDMTEDSAGGAEFKFFPALNTSAYNRDGKTFIEQMESLINNKDAQGLENLLNSTVESLMNDMVKETMEYFESIGVFAKANNSKNSPYKYFGRSSEGDIRDRIKNFVWNNAWAQSQLIQLYTGDLALYPHYTEYIKRVAQLHAATDKVNTLAKWDGKYVLADAAGNVRKARAIGLADEVTMPSCYEEVRKIVNDWTKTGRMSQKEGERILKLWKESNPTNAQAYRTLKSFRAVMIGLGRWNEESEGAYNNARAGKLDYKDFMVLWNNLKPYMYTLMNVDDGFGGKIRKGVQHKNAEMIMLTTAIFGGVLNKSPRFKALSDFMEKHDIDVAMFGTAIKTGSQGLIDLNSAETAKEVNSILEKNVLDNGGLNLNVVTEYDWNDWGIIQDTPVHGPNSLITVSSQMRVLMQTDISDDAVFDVGGRKLTKEQWLNFLDAITIANIRSSAESLNKQLSSKQKVAATIKSAIKNSSRYSNDLLEALQFADSADFNLEIADFNTSRKLQELLCAMFRERIVKQKITGMGLIQSAAWCLPKNKRPKIHFATDSEGRTHITGVGAWIPCPDSRLYALLMEEDGSININKKDKDGNYILPRKYLQMIGHRTPNEGKHSMLPIVVEGFLPRQNGDIILLADGIDIPTGTDNDADKMYVSMHNLSFKDTIDYKAAWKDFYKEHPEIAGQIRELKRIGQEADSLVRALLGEEGMEDMKGYEYLEGTKELFNEWFSENRGRYTTTKVEVVEYEGASNGDTLGSLTEEMNGNSKAQRDNLWVDLAFALLTHPDTAGKQINPSNFIELKEEARRLAGKREAVNPLSPATWVSYHHRNMAGANLTSIAAMQNSVNAVAQRAGTITIVPKFTYVFNGIRLSRISTAKAFDSSLVTKNVGTVLAAILDNAKDPVAAELNITEDTISLVETLLRARIPVHTVCLIMKQPVIDRVLKLVNGGMPFATAIQEAFAYYAANRRDVNHSSTSSFDFKDSGLQQCIDEVHLGEGNYDETWHSNYQLRVLSMVSGMMKVADALDKVNKALRYDSTSGNIGGAVAYTQMRLYNLYSLLEDMQGKNFPLSGLGFIQDMAEAASGAMEIEDTRLPVMTAFFKYGIIEPLQLLREYFPQASDEAFDLINVLTKYSVTGRIGKDAYANILHEYYMYKMTLYSSDMSGSKESRDYYINKFPLILREHLSNHPELRQYYPLFRRLQVKQKNGGSPIISFHNVGKMTETLAEQFRTDFRRITMSKNHKTIARGLLIYAMYRGMLPYGDSFAHLIPTYMKTSSMTDYALALRKMVQGVWNNSNILERFIKQYVRIHPNNRVFVKHVSKADVRKLVSLPDSAEVTFSHKSDELKQFGRTTLTGEFIPYSFVRYSVNRSSATYQITEIEGDEHSVTLRFEKLKPLGSANFLEYSAGNDDIETVIVPEETAIGADARLSVLANALGSMSSPRLETDDSAPQMDDATRDRLDRAAQSFEDELAKKLAALGITQKKSPDALTSKEGEKNDKQGVENGDENPAQKNGKRGDIPTKSVYSDPAIADIFEKVKKQKEDLEGNDSCNEI